MGITLEDVHVNYLKCLFLIMVSCKYLTWISYATIAHLNCISREYFM